MEIEATPKELADFVSLLQNQKMSSNDKPIMVSEPQINLARMTRDAANYTENKISEKNTAKKAIRIIERLGIPLEIIVDDGEKFVKKPTERTQFNG